MTHIIESYCRHPDYKGCFRKCPCPGRWINCNYYVDVTERENRLKRKELDPDIKEWYNISFRIEWYAGSYITNG